MTKTPIENMKTQAEHIAELEGKLENALEALERIGKGEFAGQSLMSFPPQLPQAYPGYAWDSWGEFAGQSLMSFPPQDAGAHFARMTLATIKLKGKCDD